MATTFFMKLLKATDEIKSVATAALWQNIPDTEEIRSASFGVSEPADVVTPIGYPLDGGFFTSGGSYTPPVEAFLKATWSGAGTLVGTTYEMTPDALNVATLTFQKWDRNADAAISSGGEDYWVCVEGFSAKPNVGRINLSETGEASLTFIPLTDELGMGHIALMSAVPGSPMPDHIPSLGLS